ncbi:hypothetical protein FOXB_06035 [Fusarium oxysporum f. sp. conglutinans Fo5176]|uniref:Plasma membrane proteolipid 3 n=1 Tax=Fusarium oxysporum (strain Fo5176) TaxID=660025 RepID=F9FI06_FUSOF|nr:hypothetical protein FOXB_06035 [Fusarium oxysporum f. sp. conglutinans Fo5176]
MPFTCTDPCKILAAIFIPPLGVFMERGCGGDFWINLLLTCLCPAASIVWSFAENSGQYCGFSHYLPVLMKGSTARNGRDPTSRGYAAAGKCASCWIIRDKRLRRG